MADGRRWWWAGRTCFFSAWGNLVIAFLHGDMGYIMVAVVLMAGALYCQAEGEG